MPQEYRRSLGKRVPRWWPVLAVALPVVLLAGCQNAPSIMAPKSPGARSIADLGWQLFTIALPVFIVVEALLIYTIVRFRHRGEEGEPRQVHGHTRLEVAWTAAPGLVLIGVLFVTFQTMAAYLQPPPDTLRVEVIAHQWWWEIRYPDLHIVTANEIHAPVGKPVSVKLTSADVIHSFWAPELGGKLDVIPGHENETWFQAEMEGTFRGFCAEYCGMQHANMGFLVVAEPQTSFEAWAQRMQSPAVATGAAAQQGLQAFTAAGCSACHTIAGTPAQGKIGPDLTHVGSRRMLAANVLENTPENMVRWLTRTQEVKPGNFMRVPPLSDEQARQIAAYLASLE